MEKVDNIKCDKRILFFVGNIVEPIHNSVCIFPLVDTSSLYNFRIYSDLFTDFTYFRLAGVNKTAGWVVLKIGFMIL